MQTPSKAPDCRPNTGDRQAAVNRPVPDERNALRTFTNCLMRTATPGLHLKRAYRTCRHVYWCLHEGFNNTALMESHEVAAEAVKVLLAATGLPGLYRTLYRRYKVKLQYADLDPDTKGAVQVFMGLLSEAALPPISRVLLYGSRARGDHYVYSDADIAVVLPGAAPDSRTRSALQDTLFDIGHKAMMKTDPTVDVSAWIMWEDQLSQPDKQRTPVFYRNVSADGIEIRCVPTSRLGA